MRLSARAKAKFVSSAKCLEKRVPRMTSYHANSGGGLSSLAVREHAVPQSSPGEVHIRVRANSLNAREFSLFDGRRQLIVYRAFFEPGVYGWPEHACRGCSFVADAAVQVVELER